MPTYLSDDDTPVVHFDPDLEISPFVVFRRLREGRPLVVIDARAEPGARTLEGALPLTERWQPPKGVDTVLFDDDGGEALELVRRFREAGHSRVKALFGGLDLYEFSLDPKVVGEETFLIVGDSGD